ncbi:flagellar hook-length control protein FliK [Falsibacillus albus]|uniref:Flagellar hook-length control protein FliK n=1 Tax=Falsibacillus albus TaxID=2478915 RepID=A0A3L7K4V7_9BACI|nr:flagellar hook-length control protein FliK [Falsibacillus albus]RLQ95742.1 flagellar hook-length control protein FliK [Falsibacillus albus]
MNVAGLMLSTSPNRAANGGPTGDVKVGSGFRNILGALNQHVNGGQEPQQEGINLEDLEKLLVFLNQPSASLPQADPEADKKDMTLSEISTALGLTKEGLLKSIKELFGKTSQLKGANNKADTKAEGNEDPIQMLLVLLQQISNLPKASFKQLPPQSLANVLKAAKVFESLSASKDLNIDGIKKLVDAKEGINKIKNTMTTILANPQKTDAKSVLKSSFAQMMATGTLKDASNVSQKQTAVKTEGRMDTSFQPNMSKIEQFVIFAGKDSKTPSFDSFVKQFSDILSKSQLTQLPNGNKLLIKLYPEHLGSLRIELLQQDGKMTATMLASTSSAKDLLENNLSHLKAAFHQQNINVDKVEIMTSANESQRFDRQNQQQSSQQEQPKDEQNGHAINDPEEMGFAEELSELLTNTTN